MGIERIGAVGDDSFSLIERARQLAEQYQSARLQDQGVRTGVAAPNVTTSAVYSPAVYAQAAAFQLYTQTGALAALGGSAASASASVAPRPTQSVPDPIKAVNRAEGSRLDARA